MLILTQRMLLLYNLNLPPPYYLSTQSVVQPVPQYNKPPSSTFVSSGSVAILTSKETESVDEYVQKLNKLYLKAYRGSGVLPGAENMGQMVLANQFVSGL